MELPFCYLIFLILRVNNELVTRNAVEFANLIPTTTSCGFQAVPITVITVWNIKLT